MPYIYERAKLVVLWLRNDQHIILPVWPEPRKIPPFEISGHTQQYEDQRLLFNYLMMICSNEYWNRLWIIQEIGKARKLVISFGQDLIDWKRFMETIILSWPYPGWIVEEIMEDTVDPFEPRLPRTAFSDTVPWKLYHQLLKKYDGGHKLHNLMVNHRHALCKEPRDKVYGLIGLATDCYAGFPLDYRKTLYEVWKDTVIFKNSDTQVHQGDILKFSKLVRDSLGGPGITTIKEISQDAFLKMPQKENRDRCLKDNNPTVLKIPARLVGQIVHLGPSHVQIMTDLSKTADWRLNIQHHLPKEVQASVQEESDLFLESLEDLDETDLKIVSTCDFEVSWHPEIMPQGLSDPNIISKKLAFENEPLLRDRFPHSSSDVRQSLSRSPVEGARLFLLNNSIKKLPGLDGTRATSSDTPGNMGLGPAAARVGDYLCEIVGIKRAAIIRRSKNKLSFIGTAGLAQQAQHARKGIKSTLGETFSPFSLPKFEHSVLDDMVDLYLYVPLAYQLLD
ncbi:22466878-a66f-4687-b053-925e6e57bb5e [Sclerotinia trifoliorum]|uniref:22466878-a66f-4687-b053-925e6e57bb5e n=1 Tax=Sclerotinia trifoliorum TaxID=28548 RepID=A0A8H2ZPV7_9HELO|nr:22466878-a66f-4687-b053-925e6e57bb5e [Sclerotinia trifoliorum]